MLPADPPVRGGQRSTSAADKMMHSTHRCVPNPRLAMTSAWLITGSNRGIGLELTRQLHERGEPVIAVCRKPSPEL